MTSYEGLTSLKASQLLAHYGPNHIPEKKKSFLKKVFLWIISPVSIMLLIAAGLSLFNGSYADFWIIIVLFVSNFAISLWHERKADTSVKKLQQHLTLKVKTLRDGVWNWIDSFDLVPGDIIELKIGSVVPADARILDLSNVTINESVLTGESLPKEKKIGDTAYSGSFVTTGHATARVTVTGIKTHFGQIITLIDPTPHQSALEKDILSISKFISIISIIIVFILTTVLIAIHSSIADILTLDVSLLIAGIPVALTTVMSLIISIGVVELAQKNIIVRRLASLEDLANVDILLSDKTGTLTENKIHIEKVIPFDGYNESDILKLACSVISDEESNPLEHAIAEKADEQKITPYMQTGVIPADSLRKRSTALVVINSATHAVALGAPQVIEGLSILDEQTRTEYEKDIQNAAENGFRVLGLAINPHGIEEKNMHIAGILYLADKVHTDAKDTLHFMDEHGIEVKMLTGDNFEISKRIAEELGLKGRVERRGILDTMVKSETSLANISVFSEVLPEDKFNLVTMFEKQHHLVAVTGDGINDLPAVKAANVGFAVSNAVDALKSTADIVLAASGISVIKNAIIEARKIFVRLYNYSVYRISESFRIVITIAVIGLLFKTYPLTPVQLIVLAFLNDVPIISLAFDRVEASTKPSHVNARERFTLSTLFGAVGVANSLILFFIMVYGIHLPWPMIQTVFFLKLTVSGHMLIYVAHTKKKWFTFLPSKQVIFATIITQLIATLLALFGIFTAKISLGLVVLVWVWSFGWMQVGELMKFIQQKILYEK